MTKSSLQGSVLVFGVFFIVKKYITVGKDLWKSSSSKTEQEIKLLMEKGQSQSLSSEEIRDVLDV